MMKSPNFFRDLSNFKYNLEIWSNLLVAFSEYIIKISEEIRQQTVSEIVKDGKEKSRKENEMKFQLENVNKSF